MMLTSILAKTDVNENHININFTKINVNMEILISVV